MEGLKVKHTPGPWKIAGTNRRIVDIDNRRVATTDLIMENVDLFDEGEREANAALIAAAPEQHELIGLLVSVMRKAAQGDEVGWSYWIKEAEQLHAKAEGRS